MKRPSTFFLLFISAVSLICWSSLLWAEQGSSASVSPKDEPKPYSVPQREEIQQKFWPKGEAKSAEPARRPSVRPPMGETPEQSAPKNPGGVNKLVSLRGVRFHLNFGYLYGELNELVMASNDDSFDLDSRIGWRMQDTITVSASFDIQRPRFYFGLGVFLPLVLSKARVASSEWLFDNPPGGTPPYNNLPASSPSHYSISNTENEFSFAAHTIIAFNLLADGLAPRLELGVSFMYMTWSWRALDTRGLYFLDDQGVFGAYLPLSSTGDTTLYRIHYIIPAASVRFIVRWGIYGLETLVNYSPATIFIDQDQDLIAKISSTGLGLFGQMVWGSFTNRFWLSQTWSFVLGLRGKVLFRSRIGSLLQSNHNTGATRLISNGAGSEYFDIEAFVGITLRF